MGIQIIFDGEIDFFSPYSTMSSEMKKVQPTLKKIFLVFSREANIVKKNTNDEKVIFCFIQRL